MATGLRIRQGAIQVRGSNGGGSKLNQDMDRRYKVHVSYQGNPSCLPLPRAQNINHHTYWNMATRTEKHHHRVTAGGGGEIRLTSRHDCSRSQRPQSTSNPCHSPPSSETPPAHMYVCIHIYILVCIYVQPP